MASAKERSLILSACAGGRTNSKGFVRVNCPVCPSRIGKQDGDASLGYRPETGGFRCFKCGVNGRMQGEGYVLPEVADAVTKEDDRPKVIIPRDDFYPIHGEEWDAYSMEEPREYLRRRGFTRDHLRTADVHVALSGRYAGRVIIPHKEPSGEWWGFTSRIYVANTGDAPKVLYPKNMDRSRLYNGQALEVATRVPALVVEGCLDSVWYQPRCCATLGKPTPDHFEHLCRSKRPVVFCLDGDLWEMGRALMMRMRLRGRLADFVRIPAGEDPNSIDPAWLLGEVDAKAAAWKEPTCTPSNPSP